MRTFVARVDELKTGRGNRFTIDGEEIVVFIAEGSVHAFANHCPHQHFQKLHEGEFRDGIVTCPMHGWSYDVRTGISTNASGRLRAFPVEVVDGKVFIIHSSD